METLYVKNQELVCKDFWWKKERERPRAVSHTRFFQMVPYIQYHLILFMRIKN